MGVYEKCLCEIKVNQGKRIMVRKSDRNKALYVVDGIIINFSGFSTNEDLMANDWTVLEIGESIVNLSDILKTLYSLPDGFVAVNTDEKTKNEYIIKIDESNREKLYINMFDVGTKDFLYNINGRWDDYKPSVSDMISRRWQVVNFDRYLKLLIEMYLTEVNNDIRRS